MNYSGYNPQNPDTICALATPPGTSAIAIIRVSGPGSFQIAKKIFKPKNTSIDIENATTHHIYFGDIYSGEELLDEVLLSSFVSPHSYTGEDSLEISCHGSPYIYQKIIELLFKSGCRLAGPGEFTLRAFINGKFDLSQAEAVADLIASSSKTSHDLALNQMRGNFSNRIQELRTQMLDFASFIELELDFSEEDVEFADRAAFNNLLNEIHQELDKLIQSFEYGQVIRQGIPVAIVGAPNVGKSTLLNALLNEEKAIVSEIPGTTRDSIEDMISIEGVNFRFIDTAGIRKSSDEIETMGIERTFKKIDQAKIILYLFDVSQTPCYEVKEEIQQFREHINNLPNGESKEKKFIVLANKIDQLTQSPEGFKDLVEMECIFISAKKKENINLVLNKLVDFVLDEKVTDTAIISNTRHFEALNKAREAVDNIKSGFDQGIPSDLIAIDIKQALYHLGEITGEVTNDEILGNIFSKFCIGK